MTTKNYTPVTPGEMLLEEFLNPLGVSQNQLARDIDVSPSRIAGIIHGTREITVDTAVRLSKYFGNSAQFWLNMQTRYDLEAFPHAELIKIEQRIRPIQALAIA